VKAVLRQVHNGFHYTLGFGGSVHALEYHILAMTTGELLAGFFAVRTVHHDCEGTEL